VKDETNDTIKELITRHLAGEASVDDEKVLQKWRRESTANEAYFASFQKVFLLNEQSLGKSSSGPLLDVDQEWNHFLNRVNKKKVLPLERSGSIWLKVAAAILLLVVSGLVINYLVQKDSDVFYQTAANTQLISLPDGSQVTLNRHSRLTYTADFGKTLRSVNLKGEAFFEVKRDPQKPFTITANNALIEVLGTSFNVMAYDSLQNVEVTVQTGLVKLTVPQLNQTVKLSAGEKGTFYKDNQGLVSLPNDDQNFSAWKTQKLIFKGENLQSVVTALQKAYGANISIPADIPATCELTVTFDHQSLEAVMRVLENTLGLTYTINGNQIVITHAGC
jgi:transmembrane sensor